jgi:hypothetical protein
VEEEGEEMAAPSSINKQSNSNKAERAKPRSGFEGMFAREGVQKRKGSEPETDERKGREFLKRKHQQGTLAKTLLVVDKLAFLEGNSFAKKKRGKGILSFGRRGKKEMNSLICAGERPRKRGD